MITPTFTQKDVQAYVQQQVQNRIKAIIATYQFVGEGFVRDARLKTNDQGGFRDVTGNLRSSIGYLVILDGKNIHEGFEESGAGTDKATGKSKGKEFAEQIAAQYPKGIVLIVVAGMQYAASVESRGKDVITGSSLGIEKRLQNLLRTAA